MATVIPFFVRPLSQAQKAEASRQAAFRASWAASPSASLEWLREQWSGDLPAHVEEDWKNYQRLN